MTDAGTRRPAVGLARRSWSSGSRTALLVHGSTSSSATWWRVGPALAARGWSVTALDLPSHGASRALGDPAHPGALAAALATELAGGIAAGGEQGYDLLLGHSLGAVAAIVLLAEYPELAGRLVLEEPPGPNSTDWAAEADAVERSAAAARRDPGGELARTVAAQPRWEEQDCRYAVDGLLTCAVHDVAAGLRLGPGWPLADPARHVHTPTLVLAAPDAPGVNSLEDATALRGADRQALLDTLPAPHLQILDTGHCIHRDDPAGWIDAITSFASSP